MEKRCEGAQPDSPEMRSSTAVSFLVAFAGENLALVEPVAGPPSCEEGTCVRGPIRHPRGPSCAGHWLCGGALAATGPGGEGSPPPPHTSHCGLWALPPGHGLGNTAIPANSTNRLALRGGSVSGTDDAHAFLCGISTRTD